jgi:hypothetical protein
LRCAVTIYFRNARFVNSGETEIVACDDKIVADSIFRIVANAIKSSHSISENMAEDGTMLFQLRHRLMVYGASAAKVSVVYGFSAARASLDICSTSEYRKL